jgi:predicted nucleic acid-binding Zn ribbon protein
MARLRTVVIEPLPDARRAARPVGDSIERVRLVLGLGRADVLATVEEHWDQVVGPRLARISNPVTLRDARLVVETSVPAAAEQLRWQARDLAAAIGALCGDDDAVAQVDVRVRPTA